MLLWMTPRSVPETRWVHCRGTARINVRKRQNDSLWRGGGRYERNRFGAPATSRLTYLSRNDDRRRHADEVESQDPISLTSDLGSSSYQAIHLSHSFPDGPVVTAVPPSTSRGQPVIASARTVPPPRIHPTEGNHLREAATASPPASWLSRASQRWPQTHKDTITMPPPCAR